jgi:hypothetical protein
MMTNIRIKAVSQYGNVKIEGNDSWINGESPEIKDFIKNNFKAGDYVNMTLSQDNKIAIIERAEVDQTLPMTDDVEETPNSISVSFKELTLIRQNACRHAASMIDILQRQGEFETHPPSTVKAAFFEFAGEVEKWILRKK